MRDHDRRRALDYPLAIGLMVASAILPFYFFKRKGCCSRGEEPAKLTRHYRSRDCVAKVTLLNMDQRGFELREQHQWLGPRMSCDPVCDPA